MLSLDQLIEHADAVLPIENQALHDIVAKVDKQVNRSSNSSSAATVDLISKGAAASQSQSTPYRRPLFFGAR